MPGGGAFGRRSGLDENVRGPRDGTSGLTSRDTRARSLSWEGPGRTRQEGSPGTAPISQHLDLGFLASRTLRNKLLLFQPRPGCGILSWQPHLRPCRLQILTTGHKPWSTWGALPFTGNRQAEFPRRRQTGSVQRRQGGPTRDESVCPTRQKCERHRAHMHLHVPTRLFLYRTVLPHSLVSLTSPGGRQD